MEKDSINARIKALRKSQRLSQAEFGENIGLKQVAVSNLEKEGNTVTEQNLALICQRFHIRRDWLVNGEGEMNDSTESSLFASFAKQYNLSEAEQRAARYLLQLSSEERQQILHHITGLASAITEPDHSDIDAELEAYKQELLAAEKGRSVSGTGVEEDA